MHAHNNPSEGCSYPDLEKQTKCRSPERTKTTSKKSTAERTFILHYVRGNTLEKMLSEGLIQVMNGEEGMPDQKCKNEEKSLERKLQRYH